MSINSQLPTPNSRLTLGFSPCPNDCFIFDALLHGKIDTEGLTFEVFMEDVETLNQKAFKGVKLVLSYNEKILWDYIHFNAIISINERM